MPSRAVTQRCIEWQAPVEQWATDCATALGRADNDLETVAREFKRQHDLGKSLRIIAAEVTAGGYPCGKSKVDRMISALSRSGTDESFADSYAEVNHPSEESAEKAITLVKQAELVHRHITAELMRNGLLQGAGRLNELEARIAQAENLAVGSRHKFGTLLLAEKAANGGKLPRGRMREIVESTGRRRAEIGQWETLAEEYPDLARFWVKFGSWDEFVAVVCR